MVERVSDKDKVEGPIPSTPTNRGPLAQLVERWLCIPKVTSSNLVRSTFFMKNLKKSFPQLTLFFVGNLV